MSWGVALRNAVGLGLGGIPSLLNAPPYAKLAFNFLSGELDPRITFSRTSNATLIGSDGTLQYAPHNLLTYSEQFDNAAWTKAQSTITSNSVTAPDGTTTADKLVEDATNSQHVLFRSTSISLNTTHAASGYFKAGERTRINFRLLNGTFNSGANVTFDLSAGTTPFSSLIGTATNLLFSITPVGDGWYRCSVSCVVDATSTAGVWAAYLVNTGNNDTYTGDGTSGIYVWGAQLNVGALQPYYSTTVKNLLGYSQEFDNAAWSKSNSTITADVTAAPNGSMTADKLVEDTATSNHLIQSGAITVISNTKYTVSIYAKASERSQVRVALSAVEFTNGRQALFDLQTGTVAAVETGATAAVVSIGNGWYRCAVTATASVSGSNPVTYQLANGATTPAPQSYTGDGTSGIYIWGAQFSDSASLDPYVYNPAAAPSNTAYYGPRFDYDPVTLAPKGLLIEEQRTNSIRNNTMQGAVAGTPGTLPTNWVSTTPANGITREIVGVGVEDGIQYIDFRFYGTNTLGGAFYMDITFDSGAITAAQGQSWTESIYARLMAGTVSGAAFASVPGLVLYSTPNFNDNGSLRPISVSNAKLSSQRFSATRTLANATSTGVSPRFSWTIDTGATIDFTIRIGLPQLEQGAFATSVIPTTTTALTRAADVASVTGDDFSSWYNPVEGTMVAEALTFNSSVSKYPVSAHDGSQAELIAMYFLNANGGGFVIDNSVTQVQIESAGLATQSKIAFAFKLNDFAMCINGSSPATDASGTIPTVNRLQLGNRADGVRTLNGHIRSFKYYPTRLSNGQLQALTK